MPSGVMSTLTSARSASISSGVRHRTCGVDAPIPRGSKPIMSKRSCNSVPEPEVAIDSPDPPGPPGFSNSEPMRSPVAFEREITTFAVSPFGFA